MRHCRSGATSRAADWPRRREYFPTGTSAVFCLCALGAREELVGVSHECDHPAGVGELPVLTIPKVAARPTSLGVDRAVRDLVRASLAVYDLDLDRTRPDSPVVRAHGRLVFEWADVCDGWTVSQRTHLAITHETGGEIDSV